MYRGIEPRFLRRVYDLIASATPTVTIADPVNPKPGMVFKGYNVEYIYGRKFGELPSVLQKAPAVKTTVVTTEKFSFEDLNSDQLGQGVWEGFLKCKRSANCTFVVKQSSPNGAGYILIVNGKRIICGWGQHSATVDMKAGFNHIKLISQTRSPIYISLKATGSTREPKPLTPKDMFYDDKPDEGDVF